MQESQKVQKCLIIHGRIRSKFQLLKIAAAQAKRAFNINGDVEVIDLSPYKQSITGYVVIVEY
jgi:hypothetical protein